MTQHQKILGSTSPTTDSSLWGLFAEAVLRNPDAMAVSDGPTRLTYTQLDRRAAGLAGRLQNTGIGRGDRVVIALPRSLDLITAILAVSRRGATAVPLTPGLPPARLKTILDTVHPKAVICPPTDHHHYAPHPRITDLTDLTTTHPGTTVPVTPHDTAYIVFTSGTSGTPKGVLIPHHGLTALRATQHTTAPTQPGSRILQFSTVGFDVLFWEISWSLFTGAELVIIPEEQRLGPELPQFLHDHNITHAGIPPAVITTWPTETTLPHDITLAVGTESMPPALIHRWAPHCRLINCYGPTETTINATLWKAPPHWNNKNVPIGHPDTGKRIYLLDHNLQPTPHGTTGEIFIAGAGIATGYLNNPTLTAQHFLPDPHGNPGDRMYRTGDTGRWNNNNELEFHGRTDRQIQIRGHRVEPTEIEKHLTALNDITTATITTRETPHGTQLIAYIVTNNHHPTPTWKEQLATHLPHYMLPTHIIPLTHLPLTTNNKIDHTRLPPPTTTPPNPHHTPQTPLQHHITNTFADILQLPTIGIHDNFFTHGGDSIRAILLVNRCRALGLQIGLRTLLDAPTVAGLIRAAKAAGPAKASRRTAPARTKPTPVMAELLASRQNIDDFSQVVVVEMPRTPAEVIHRAWSAVTARHGVLRSRLVTPGDDPGQAYLETVTGEGVTHFTLAETDSADLAGAVESAVSGLRPSAGLMSGLRTVHRSGAPAQHLVVAVHHLAVDLISWHLLLAELADAVRGDLPAGTSDSTFAHWSELLHEEATGEETVADAALWTNVLRPGEDIVARLFPEERRAGATFEHEVALPSEVTAPLMAMTEQRRLPLGHLALQALGAALAAELADAEAPLSVYSLLVELESHGRSTRRGTDLDLAGAVGWFTSLFPFRFTIGDPTSPLLEGTRRITDTIGRIPDLGLSYGMLRYLHPEFRESLARLPMPPVLYNYLGQVDFGALPAGWTVRRDQGLFLGGRDHGGAESAHVLALNSVLLGGDTPSLATRWSWRGLGDDALLLQRAESVMNRWTTLLTDLAVTGPGDSPEETVAASAFGLTLTAADAALLEETL
ncbi:amino acid adenylation domain-containing protein [Streptomyces anulatus]|uniref:amino acid adenylation domain-containing protein n=1 Tax=Streptomyces anulatus TaxID=1892 RepID=UPI0036F6BC4B